MATYARVLGIINIVTRFTDNYDTGLDRAD